MNFVSKEQIRIARRVNLYEFMVTDHPAMIKREGNAIRLIEHDSIFIKRGDSGYVRYSDRHETGNSVDFLIRYIGYSLPDAVLALNECSSALQIRSPTSPPAAAHC